MFNFGSKKSSAAAKTSKVSATAAVATTLTTQSVSVPGSVAIATKETTSSLHSGKNESISSPIPSQSAQPPTSSRKNASGSSLQQKEATDVVVEGSSSVSSNSLDSVLFIFSSKRCQIASDLVSILANTQSQSSSSSTARTGSLIDFKYVRKTVGGKELKRVVSIWDITDPDHNGNGAEGGASTSNLHLKPIIKHDRLPAIVSAGIQCGLCVHAIDLLNDTPASILDRIEKASSSQLLFPKLIWAGNLGLAKHQFNSIDPYYLPNIVKYLEGVSASKGFHLLLTMSSSNSSDQVLIRKVLGSILFPEDATDLPTTTTITTLLTSNAPLESMFVDAARDGRNNKGDFLDSWKRLLKQAKQPPLLASPDLPVDYYTILATEEKWSNDRVDRLLLLSNPLS